MMENTIYITHLWLPKQLAQNLCIEVSVHQEFGSSSDRVVLTQWFSRDHRPPYAFKVAQSHDWQVGAGFGQEASGLCHVGLPIRLLQHPHCLAADLLQSERSRRRSQDSFYDPALEITHHHFHHHSLGCGGQPYSM